MLVCKTPAEMQAACRDLRKSGSHTLGLVPTMGALHAGHISLVSAALSECDSVAASIFVNPTQFAPGEDFEAYPRDFEADWRKLAAAGVHILFAPSTADMYPPGNTTFVEPGEIGTRLDGASRPGHFRGVATIVARLFHIVAPDRAYFGQKDAAQVAVLRHIVRDLNFPIHLGICPIVRESDGLAMSSRNCYLTAEERGRALILSRALAAAQNLAAKGETKSEALRAAILAVFFTDPMLHLDYASIVDPDTLLPVADISRGALIAVAAWIGKTRLIDNLIVQPQ
ncbi:MAG TPA: pantoate--beta-alanine ligase [Acidobacteriaceae bacterium]